jgi:biopolymer transport protein TolQ
MDVVESIYEAYATSDACGKGIVLMLLLLSAVIWTLIINSLYTNWTIARSCELFRTRYDSLGASRLRISRETERATNNNSPLSQLCRDGVSDLQSVMDITEDERLEMNARGTLPRKVTDDQIDHIQTVMANSMAAQLQAMQNPLTWIGTIASVAPMLGLFGTVWGVMMTFIGIVAAGGRPDIKAIAPGISGALLTTVAGLAVAIPALLMNNIILLLIQKIEGQMDSFTTEFLAMLKLCKVKSEE